MRLSFVVLLLLGNDVSSQPTMHQPAYKQATIAPGRDGVDAQAIEIAESCYAVEWSREHRIGKMIFDREPNNHVGGMELRFDGKYKEAKNFRVIYYSVIGGRLLVETWQFTPSKDNRENDLDDVFDGWSDAHKNHLKLIPRN